MNINKIILVGRVATDPIYSETAGKEERGMTARLEFRLVVNRQKSENSDGVKCVLWGNYAQTLAEHIKKGKEIGVEGQLRTSRVPIEGSEKYNYFFEVKVDSVSLGADSKKGAPAATAATTRYRMVTHEDGTVTRERLELPAKHTEETGVSAETLATLAAQLDALQNKLDDKTHTDATLAADPFEDVLL